MTASTLRLVPPIRRRMSCCDSCCHSHLTGDQYIRASCCPPFRQPPISYKTCVYGCQHQTSSFKSSNRLPPKRSRDFFSLASHEPGFFVLPTISTPKNMPCLRNWRLKVILQTKLYLFLRYYHRVFITSKMQRWLAFRA
jgi:hypothetical protein